MMKKLSAFLSALVLLLLCAATASARGLVTDETGSLTSEEIAHLTGLAEGIGEKYGIVAMIRFVERTPGYQTGYYGLREYAADAYDSEHAGEDGVIFAVRLSDRWYVSVTTGRGEKILTTEALDAAEDDVQPLLKDEDYYEAFRKYLKDIDTLLERYEKGERFGNKVSLQTPMERLMGMLLIIGVFSALNAVLVLLIVRRNMKTARKKNEAGDYVSQARLTRRQDIYLYTTTTRRKIESSSGSGSHGSGGHFGGGGGHGSSHGGRF